MNKLAWNARRYPDDQLWVAEEPIAAKFLARSAATISSRAWVAAWEAETVSAMKDCKDIDWRYRAAVWVGWCIGYNVHTDTALKMLVEGLWIGCTQKDLLMSFLVHEQRILDNVELANISQHKHSMLVHDFATGIGDEYHDTDDSDDENEQQSTKARFPLPKLTKDQRKKLYETLADNWDAQFSICHTWYLDFKSYLLDPRDDIRLETRTHHACLYHTQVMRGVPKKIYNTSLWRSAIKRSSLCDVFAAIGEPGALLAANGPHSRNKAQWCCWVDVLTHIDHLWTPLSATSSDRPQLPFMQTPERMKGRAFFMLLKTLLAKYPDFIPLATNGNCVFFLESQNAFQWNWNTWLCPSLVYCGESDAARYDSSHIFRSLPPAMVPTEVGEMDLPENLFTIVTETYELRQLRKISRKNAFRPTITPSSSPPSISLAEYPSFASISHLVPDLSRTTSCQRCVDLSTDQHCIQSYPVDEFPNYKEYDGAVLTFAPPNDYLDPKSSQDKPRPNAKYYSPSELGMKKVASRPQVYRHCGRDVGLVYERSTGTEIGKVAFRALQPQYLASIGENIDAISVHSSLLRREKLQMWAYGDIWATGARVPRGGRLGDSYGLYAHHSVSSPEGIKAIFGHAYDQEMLVQSASPHFRDLIQYILNTTNDAQMKRLGATGGNMFYCHNYISPSHTDEDECQPLTAQIRKSCLPDEYHFAYVKWGFFLQTEPGAIWSFKSEEDHAIVMPRRSSVQSSVYPAVSDGVQLTLRSRDYNMALRCIQIRSTYADRVEYWKSYEGA